MTQNPEKTKEPRVNVSIIGDEAVETEHLRALLEKRLKQRLSMAQVFKRLVKLGIKTELELVKSEVDSSSLPLKF